MSDELVRVVHGVRLLIPPEWEDSSLYRFNAPAALGDVPKTSKDKLQLQANVMVTRHGRNPEDAPERFFEVTNADAHKQNPTFKVPRSGSVIYLDQVAFWQDTAFNDPNTSVNIFQRMLLIPSWPQHLTLITITGTEAGVERICTELGLTNLTDTPGGSRVKTSEGVVGGKLVSK